LQKIDRVLHAALRYKKPVYIELPRDMVSAPGRANHKPADIHETSDPVTLRESLAEAAAMINRAKKPVILADVEVHRFGLQKELLRLMEKTNIPAAATIMGKSVIGENHRLYLGIYGGVMGREEVRRYVEQSDCLLMLGVFMTDIDQGIRTARLNPACCISATSEELRIRYHHYDGIRFKDFLRGLLKAPLRRRAPAKIPRPTPMPAFHASARKKITIRRLFQRLNSFLREDTIVISDVGDALFGATDLNIHQDTEFLGTAYYASMGFAVPAAIGAQLARPERRPLVLVGDGAFQMTGMELTTAARHGLNPIVIVLNNAGYGTERHIQDGPYNDVAPWNYNLLPDVIGSGRGFSVETEEQLEQGLRSAQMETETFTVLDVHLDPMDRSPALHRLGRSLASRL
jgi:indolepyruvate decarboxylase